jgi:hypothetical protein
VNISKQTPKTAHKKIIMDLRFFLGSPFVSRLAFIKAPTASAITQLAAITNIVALAIVKITLDSLSILPPFYT